MSARNTRLTSHGVRDKGGSPRHLLGNRAFVLLWAAFGISAFGDHVSEMAVLRTMDALEAPNLTQLQALITFMYMMPYFLLGAFNGVVADRLPRRGIMIGADLCRMILLLSFPVLLVWFGRWHHDECAGVWGQVLAFMPILFVGVFASLFTPARAALIPSLVRQNQLIAANAAMRGLGVATTMAAAITGGWLAKHYAPRVSFTITAGMFLVSALLLFLMQPPRQFTPRTVRRRGGAGVADGIRYALQHRRVIELLAISIVVWTCGAIVRSAMPALVRDVYGRSDYFQIGLFQGYFGLGLMLGALVLSIIGDAIRGEIAITWSLAGLAAAIGLLAGTSFVPIPPDVAHHIGVVAVVFAGMFGTGALASYNALIQRIVPDRMRGRIFGLADFVSTAGLLAATGLIGIPRWENIDRWIGWILLATSIAVLAAAIISLAVRLQRSPFRSRVGFWWNLNEFCCRFWFGMKREGICTIPAEGPVIVIANHRCSIDPLLLSAGSPHRLIGFVVAEEFTGLPLIDRFLRMIGCVPVKRESQDAAGTRAALRHLRDGNVLGIFIEGGIVPPGQQREPRDGAALLALHSNALIVPAHISGTRYHRSVLRPFFMRHRARVRFGQPIDLSRHWIPRADKQALHKISLMLMQRIRELGSDAD